MAEEEIIDERIIPDYKPASIFLAVAKLAAEQKSAREQAQETGKDIKKLKEVLIEGNGKAAIVPRVEAIEKRLDGRSRVANAIVIAGISAIFTGIIAVATVRFRPPAQDLSPIINAMQSIEAKVEASTRIPQPVEIVEKPPERRSKATRSRSPKDKEKSSHLQVAEQLRDLRANGGLAKEILPEGRPFDKD